MIKITASFAAALMLLPLSLMDDENAEQQAVRRAVQDYVEAFYEAKPELIERSVRPELTKYGFWRSAEDGKYKGSAMTFEQARSLAERWNADGQQGPDLAFEIELLDVADQTAAAKLTAKWGIDYVHLAKFEGKWKVLHILWQSHPPQAQETARKPGTKAGLRKEGGQ